MSAGPRTAYARGAAFEREVKKALELLGFSVVRSPRSAGAFDLLAVRRGETLMIQCKKHGACAPEEWDRLLSLARAQGAVAIIAARAARQPLKLWKIVRFKGEKRGRNPWVAWEP